MVAFIYEALNQYEPELATELHQHEHAPPFALSEFIQTGPYNTNDEGLSCERGYWTITSDDSAILDAVANHARHHEMKLGHTTIPVEGVDLEPIEGVESARYRTLSPVYVSQYREDRREDLFPTDGMWFARLRDNVRDRMEAQWGQTPEHLVIDEVHWWKKKRLRVGDGWSSAARMEVDIESDPETSHYIQQQGLGERTGMGFGTVMPIQQIPEEWR
jgi:CRISPR-associated endoribonuclease Cas6